MTQDELKRRTKAFALRVMTMTDSLPRNAKGRVLANQLLRIGTSVASGFRAACRARSHPDWVDKVGRILEEADESGLWIELIHEGALLPAKRIQPLLQEASELTAIFAAMHKTSKTSPKSEIRNPKS
jgi:four helix bundle protein